MSGQANPTGGVVYPTAWGVATGSSEDFYDNVITDRSFGGIIRIRSTVPLANIKKVFNVVHSVLTLTQRNDLETFYKTYRDAELDLTWKPDTLHYAVRFIDVPKFTIIGGNFWKAEVRLAEV